MTWKDLKIIVLQKVFAINDGQMKDDDTTREYLTAMPGAANEGLQLLATAGRFLKRKCVMVQGNVPNGVTADVQRPAGSGYSRYDMTEAAHDFYSLDVDGVYYQSLDGETYRRADVWAMEAGQIMVFPADLEGVWTIWYNAYPPELTAETPEDYELPLYPELAALLPLYMASQLYKDDEVSIAAQYRNEFEVGREALQSAAGRRGGMGTEKWRSVSGWWES